MDITSAERKNRWRLEQVILVCELELQQRTQKAWDTRSPSAKAALAKALPSFQRQFLTGTVAIASWDVSMCNTVLKHFGALKKEDAAPVAAIVAARNHYAHAAGGRVTTAMFKQHTDACEQALKTLGGDVAAVQKLRICELDASDVSILTSSHEATILAEREKLEGNRLFREGNFRGARECYTRGLQVAGVVDPVVRSQLFNNRATANIRLKAFRPAKEDAKHAAELAPLWAKPHLRLAEIYYEAYKPHKAVARLEIALGNATAANDAACVKEAKAKLAEYRLERDQLARRESENLAYGTAHQTEGAFLAAGQARMGLERTQNPMDLFDAITSLDLNGMGMVAKKHVILGQRASNDGRLADAAREFMAAAVAGDPEGMYNYALSLLKGRGTRKNIPEAVRWLEKAAALPINDSPSGIIKNVGIGEAMASLGNLYDGGIHFSQDKMRAREYWDRSAELGVSNGLNNLGLCFMKGTHGVEKDLPRARELFRRSAECLHNEAMSNLGVLHASLLDFETAARWADTAAKYGFLPATEVANIYKEKAKAKAMLPKHHGKLATAMDALPPVEKPEFARKNETPTLEELRTIGTPYGNRLLAAKQLIVEAMGAVHNADEMVHAVNLAVGAHRIDDSELVFSEEENRFTFGLAMSLKTAGVPAHAGLALLTKLTDPSYAITLWTSLQSQFPEDLAITKRAACMLMFEAYAGHDFQHGVQLFQRAFSLLPRPDDDSDPPTLDLLYLAGVGYYLTKNVTRAEGLLTRFLKHAPADGHRKAAEATYLLGTIAMLKMAKTPKKVPSVVGKYLREGDSLLQRIPTFLRGDAERSPHRAMLQRIVSFAGIEPVNPPASVPSILSRRRGGELVGGPRRLEELRSDTPMLQPKWRAEIAAMASSHASAAPTIATTLSIRSTQADQKPARASRDGTYSQATIDELFSALEDRVCKGRVIKCIVVSLPSFNGSSFHFVVEDSQREPSRIAVYNAHPTLIAQLVPGRVLELLDPYVRIAQDGSVMLRVDDSSAAIKVKELYVICWVCSVEQTVQEQTKRCAKCHKAIYCSKQCQTHDWRVDGHRFLCNVVEKMSCAH